MRENSDTLPLPSVGATVAGWRLVRPLPAEIHGTLGFVGVAEAAPEIAEVSEHWQRFDSSLPRALIHRRIDIATTADGEDALARDAGARHLHGGEFVRRDVELLRFDTGRMTVSFLVQEVPYSVLVTGGSTLSPGGVVTLLAPLLETIAIAHEHEYTHGGISLRNCRIDGRGHPWFVDWSASCDLQQLTRMRRDLAVLEDFRAAARVCDAIVALSAATPPVTVRDLVASLVTTTPAAGAEILLRLIDALFVWTTPEPVLMPQLRQNRSVMSKPHEQSVAHGAVSARAMHPTRVLPRAAADVSESDDDPSLFAELPTRARGQGSLRAGIHLVTAHISTVRPSVWLALTGAGVGMTLAATLL